MKNNSKRLVKETLEQKEYLKEKVINYMSNGKSNRFNSWINKKDIL